MKHWVRNLLILLLLILPVAIVSLAYLEDVAENATHTTGIISLVSNLPRIAVDVASSWGYAGIFAMMLLEAAAFPIPSEIILPLAGFLVSIGVLEFWSVVVYSTIAALIGSFIDYFLGWKLGTPLVTGQVRLPYIPAASLEKVEAWFERWGPMAVAFLRLVPGARVLISFPAGAYRMSKAKFALYTLAGCLPWNILLIDLGLWLGSSWSSVVRAFQYINLVAYGLLAILVVWIVLRLTRNRNRQQH